MAIVIADQYPASPSVPADVYDASIAVHQAAAVGVGQCFTVAETGTLDHVEFYLRRYQLTDGTLTATLRPMGTGTYGSTAIPYALPATATSNVLNVSELNGTSLTMTSLTFDNTVTLTQGEQWFICLNFPDAYGDATHYVVVGSDNSSPSHGGNYARKWLPAGSWSSQTNDLIFSVYVSKTGSPMFFIPNGRPQVTVV